MIVEGGSVRIDLSLQRVLGGDAVGPLEIVEH